VHQDGLVHVSQLSHKFVADAREVVKTGQVVKVRVQEVDLARRRIALTMKLDAPAAPAGAREGVDNRYRPAARQERARPAEPGGPGAMAAAFSRLPGAKPGRR
jgi:uncharacterized protein